MTAPNGIFARGSLDDPAFALGADAVARHGSAQAALWWTQAPPVTGERPGVIGRFAAENAADTSAVLELACGALRTAGCTVAIGPMDGNTWRSYRFVTWRGPAPRFLLEPDQPDDWPRWWLAAEFAPRDEYLSSQVDRLDMADPRLAAAWSRLECAGVAIRPLAMADYEAELGRIFAVSAIAFCENVLYTPLPREEFLAMYQRMRPLVHPALSFIAERAGEPVGFVFAVPDGEQARRGVAVDTVVVKTLAVLPGRELAGLGKVLLERCQRAAHGLGFANAIHALMHAANGSRNLGDEARVIRRYTLFARGLA
jgi:GNAT superfamily N-acetyltransferase